MPDENPHVRRKQALEKMRKELGLSCAILIGLANAPDEGCIISTHGDDVHEKDLLMMRIFKDLLPNMVNNAHRVVGSTVEITDRALEIAILSSLPKQFGGTKDVVASPSPEEMVRLGKLQGP